MAAVLRNHGISEAQIIESEEVLETRHYGRLQRGWGPPRTFDFEITTSGFEQFAQTCIPGYDRICADVARHLILEQSRSNGSVAEALEQPLRIIDHILEVMKINGLIKYATSKVGYLRMEVHWVSPELRRMLEG